MSDETAMVPVSPQTALIAFSSGEGQARMIALANEFKAMCEERSKRKEKPWVVPIGPSKHLLIEAWQYIGQRAGLIARTSGSRDVRNPVTGDFEGVHAVAEAIHLATGEVVGRAEQGCYLNELIERKDAPPYQRWTQADGSPNRHAMLGMAQTRAQSRVLASVLRFIAEIAGASGTPAEEMDGVRPEKPAKPPIKPPQAKVTRPLSEPAPATANATAEPPEGAETKKTLLGEAVIITDIVVNHGAGWTLYIIKAGGEDYSSFDEEIYQAAEYYKEAESPVFISWEPDKKKKYKNITAIREAK